MWGFHPRLDERPAVRELQRYVVLLLSTFFVAVVGTALVALVLVVAQFGADYTQAEADGWSAAHMDAWWPVLRNIVMTSVAAYLLWLTLTRRSRLAQTDGLKALYVTAGLVTTVLCLLAVAPIGIALGLASTLASVTAVRGS